MNSELLDGAARYRANELKYKGIKWAILLVSHILIVFLLLVIVFKETTYEYKYEFPYRKQFNKLEFMNTQGKEGWEIIQEEGDGFLLRRTR